MDHGPFTSAVSTTLISWPASQWLLFVLDGIFVFTFFQVVE